MTEPLFWLGLSILLVAVCLAAVLVVALPALQELARAARSAEKLFDTLRRELPPTLEAIRLTGLEISDLTDDISEGVQSTGNVVKQVDQSIGGARRQVQEVNVTTRSVLTGFKAAWRTWTRPSDRKRLDRGGYRAAERLPASKRGVANFRQSYGYGQGSAYQNLTNPEPEPENLEDLEETLLPENLAMEEEQRTDKPSQDLRT